MSNKRKNLTLEERLKIIKESDDLKLSQRQLALKYGCGKTQIRNTLQNRQKYMENYQNGHYNRIRINVHLKYAEIDRKLIEWCKMAVLKKVNITGPLLQEKAKQIADAYNYHEFTASNGWLQSFKSRHHIGSHHTNDNISGDTIVVPKLTNLNDNVTCDDTDDIANDENDIENDDNGVDGDDGICKDNNGLIIKQLREKCEKLKCECKRLREENRILKCELTKNGVNLELIRGMRRACVGNARDNRMVNDNCDEIISKNISSLVKFNEFNESDSNHINNDDKCESSEQRNRKMQFNVNKDNNDDDISHESLINVNNDDDNSITDSISSDIELTNISELLLKRRQRPKKHRCTWPGCDKRFDSTFHRDTHERVHSNHRPFKCSFEGCDYSAKNKETLSVHQRRHTGAKPYHCPYENCDFRSRQNANLKSHMLQHTGQRPFKCDWPGCERDFVNKKTWQYHKKQHTNDKAYVCQFNGCDRKFICRNDLKNHEAVHTGERKHKCSWPGCDRSFIQKSNLNIHLLQHTNQRPFPCDWPGCEWRSLTKGSLMKHKMVHTGERPFPCSRCERRFASESNLRDHIRVVHDKVRKFVCEWTDCGRSFTVRRLLNDHQTKEGHKHN